MRPARACLLAWSVALLLSLPAAAEESGLDLQMLLRELEESHPRLRAGAARLAAAESRIAPMQALPDPEVRLAYTNDGVQELTFGDSIDAALTVSYEQEMPWRGKRRLGGEVAAAEVEVARAELEIDRRALREQVILAYFDVLRVDRTGDVVEASREVLKTLLASARVRYEAGDGVLEDLLKAQTEITRVEIETAELAQMRAEAESRLNWALARAPSTPLRRLRAIPELTVPSREAALAAVEEAPAVERSRRMEAASISRLEQARLARKPDWLWGVAWAERGDLDPMVTGMVGARLPLWRGNKQDREIAAAEGDLTAARAAREAESLEGGAEVGALLARAEGARRRMELLERALIPQARSTLEAGSASYANGRTVFLALLDDALDLLEFERDLERQRGDLGAALAGIEARTGLPLVAAGRTP